MTPVPGESWGSAGRFGGGMIFDVKNRGFLPPPGPSIPLASFIWATREKISMTWGHRCHRRLGKQEFKSQLCRLPKPACRRSLKRFGRTCDEAEPASLPSPWRPGQVACLAEGRGGGRADSGSQERMNSTMQTRAEQPLQDFPGSVWAMGQPPQRVLSQHEWTVDSSGHPGGLATCAQAGASSRSFRKRDALLGPAPMRFFPCTSPILMASDTHKHRIQWVGLPCRMVVGGRGGYPSPYLGGNEKNKLEPSNTELEGPLDMSTPQATALALSHPAFCTSTPEIHTPQERGLDTAPKPWPWAASVGNSLNAGTMHDT